MANDKLWDYVRSVEHHPFEWGVHDCLTFANHCCRIQKGVGFCDDLLAEYSDAISAVRVYARQQRASVFGDIFEVADTRMTPVATLHPGPGYICCRKQAGPLGWSFGVSNGLFQIYVGEHGLTRLDLDVSTERFWKP